MSVIRYEKDESSLNKNLSVESHKQIHYGSDKRSVLVQNEVIGITPGVSKIQKKRSGVKGSPE